VNNDDFAQTGGKIVGCGLLVAAALGSLTLIILAWKAMLWTIGL
jgi:hypothetical protein